MAMSDETPLSALRRAMPDLPPRLREAARYVARYDYDAATRSMRELAQAAGTNPATFTRLAQALGYSGWEPLRDALIEARRTGPETPFSGRLRQATARPPGAPPPAAQLSAEMLAADLAGLSQLDPEPILAAATALHEAPRIWVAGYRSCRAVAQLLHYQLRLFRPDSVRLIGGAGPEDLDLGDFRAGDVVVLIGFVPYSRSIVVAARMARAAGCTVVALADRADAPVAAGASHLLLFEADRTPAFFPSLTGALALAQALAAATFSLGGEAALLSLRETEAKLAALSAYMPDQDPTP
ncbi:MurR/RpiR family transcriptional regulator [Roseomonas ludipueritiae]|uniref:MurR/RpiR family transcriptional regulator n=2 Tax=Pseudoroseomonas ludipueritiae TaxID=198093 RepID=A0ABR7RA38_9PROT|nr:MurR/RpiR family transcriptional regulator [Pseudoroseomonas ludipueritiae]